MVKSRILGFGKYLPEKRLTNFDIEKMVETSDEWIEQRTGIKERRIASENDTLAYMGAEALKNACDKVNIKCEDIDFFFVATCTPDKLFPSTSQTMLKHLGIKDRPGIDINAACSGFVYGLSLADSLIKTNEYKNIAIVGVEKFSKFLDWTDRGTCILFGDGAGAGIVSMSNGDGSAIISSYLGGDSVKGDVLSCDAGLSQQLSKEEINRKEDHFLLMDGQEVFKFAVKAVPLAINGVLEKAGMSIEQIKLIVPHQANIRIIETIAKNLKIPVDKFYINIQKYGNTSSATVPIAFSEAIEERKIERGDFILTVGFGAGLTYGANIIKY